MVHAWGRPVGALAPATRQRAYVFEYDPEWRASGMQISPLSMPNDRRKLHSFANLPEATYSHLPPVIADVLPDDFGRSVLNAYLSKEGVDLGQVTPLDRLAYLAGRGMGALEFTPDHGPRYTVPRAVEISAIVTAMRKGAKGLFDRDDETEAPLMQLLQIGTSAGGARAKAVIAWNPETHEVQSGQVPASPGFEHWVLKFDGDLEDRLGAPQDYGRIEYAYHLMATDAGIEMMPCRLLEEGGRAHFMTQRFDRVGNERVHVSTLCAMAELDYRQLGTHDYSQLFTTIDRLGLGPDTRKEAFRRMVFNVAAANCDDHTKNHSFTMTSDGTWALSPAYDVTHSFRLESDWVFQHAMSVNGKFLGATLEDFAHVADLFEVPGAAGVVDDVSSAVSRWQDFAGQAGLDVSSDKVETVSADIEMMHPR